MPPKTNVKKFTKPNSTTITLPDPDGTVYVPLAEVGGTMVWKSESVGYPTFEVHFIGPNPANNVQNFVGKGSVRKPLVLTVKTEGKFEYTVVHRAKDGNTVADQSAFGRVVPCPHCS